MYCGKFKKSPKKASRVRFYKVCILTPPILTGSARYAKLKTFFFRDDTHFSQFSKLHNISTGVLATKSIKKRTHTESCHFSESGWWGRGTLFVVPSEYQVSTKKKRWIWSTKPLSKLENSCCLHENTLTKHKTGCYEHREWACHSKASQKARFV